MHNFHIEISLQNARVRICFWPVWLILRPGGSCDRHDIALDASLCPWKSQDQFVFCSNQCSISWISAGGMSEGLQTKAIYLCSKVGAPNDNACVSLLERNCKAMCSCTWTHVSEIFNMSVGLKLVDLTQLAPCLIVSEKPLLPYLDHHIHQSPRAICSEVEISQHLNVHCL